MIFPWRFPVRPLINHATAELLSIAVAILRNEIGKLLEDVLGAHTCFFRREYSLISAGVIDASRAEIQVLLHQIDVLGGIGMLLLLLLLVLRDCLIPITGLPLD
jgi:hypothetical protein